MDRRLRVLLGSLAVLCALVGAPASTALASPSSAAAVHSAAKAGSAAASSHGCPINDFCLYTGPDFTGTRYTFTWSTPTLPSGIINNEASIVDYVQASVVVRLWFGPNYGDPHTCVIGDQGSGPTTFGNLLTPVHYYFNTGTTGTREYVYQNVHGISFSLTACTAPMNWES